MANPGTTTGSIGVIAQFPIVEEALRRIGIKFETIQSGRYKRTGSPYHDFTEADRMHLQSWVDDAHEQFVDVVAGERGLSRKQTLRYADGRVFTGRQAREMGLIDLLGDYDAAVKLAAELAGIEGEPEVVKLSRRRMTIFDLLFQQIEGILVGMSGVTLKYILY
jgi:protease-4